MQFILKEEFPDLTNEIKSLLIKEEKPQFAGQLDNLVFVDRCRCGDDDCATIYTHPKTLRPRHRSFLLRHFSNGLIIIDVSEEKIAGLEILDRKDLHQQMEKLLP